GLSRQGGRAGGRARLCDNPPRLHASLRSAEGRPACGRHAGYGGADRRDRRRPRQRQGDDLRAARLHRARGGDRGNRHRDAGAAGTRLVATFGYIGLLPGPAGTWGSLAALGVGYLLHLLGGPFLLAAAIVAGYGAGHWATRVETFEQEDLDPAHIVIDEVVGQWIALMPLSLGLWIVGAPASLFPWPGWVGAFV